MTAPPDVDAIRRPVITIDGRTLARALLDTLHADTALRAELRRTLDGAATPGPRHVSPATYARDHELAVSTVRKAIRAGRLPAVHVGRAVRIPVDARIATPDRRAQRANARDRAAARALGLVAGGTR